MNKTTNKIICCLILSTLLFMNAVIAQDSSNDEEIHDVGVDIILSPFYNNDDEAILKYHTGYNNSVGLIEPGIWQGAIRLTPAELGLYDGQNITKVNWYYYHYEEGLQSGELKIYDAGTDSEPGQLLYTQLYTVTGSGLKTITLDTPITVNASRDIWVSIEINQTIAPYYPFGIDDGPMVSGKGGWVYYLGEWAELADINDTLNYNWVLEVVIDGINITWPNQPYPVQAVIKNYGTSTEVTFNVNATITNTITREVVYNDTQTVTNLSHGADILVNFTTWIPPLSGGSFIVEICTLLEGDNNPHNDFMSIQGYIEETSVNAPPVFGSPNPENGSITQTLSFTWSIPISDPEGDLFDWTLECSNGQKSNGTGETNGTKTLEIFDIMSLTMYTVWVNATDTDGSGEYTRGWYTFMTSNIPDPPSNFTATAVSRTCVNLSWINAGDNKTYIEYNTTKTWNRGEGKLLYNGTNTLYLHTNLNFDTQYFYQAWSYNETYNTYSDTYVSDDAITDPNLPPKVTIVKPKRAVYLHNEEKLPRLIRLSFIIGNITIEVNATDEDSGIEKVEFKIRSIAGEVIVNETIYKPNEDGLYTYTWTRDRMRLIPLYTIEVVAHDKDGATTSQQMIIRRRL
jgi:hypothetical protein